MSTLYVPNWDKYQHYKDRTPPWIKLHVELLNNYDFSCLQDASKAHLILIWVLASQLENKIPNDAEWIKKRIGATEDVDLMLLIEKGFLCFTKDASNALAKRSPETETETEAEAERYLLSGAKRVQTLEEIEKLVFEDHHRGWFEENCPSVQLEGLREELVLYCRSKGKRYKDYWATLQTWGRRKQQEKKHEGNRRNSTKPKTVDDYLADALGDIEREFADRPTGTGSDSSDHQPLLENAGFVRT